MNYDLMVWEAASAEFRPQTPKVEEQLYAAGTTSQTACEMMCQVSQLGGWLKGQGTWDGSKGTMRGAWVTVAELFVRQPEICFVCSRTAHPGYPGWGCY